MYKSNLLNLIISSLLVLSIGLFIGFSLGYAEAKKASFADIRQVKELNRNIATIKFMKSENDIIYGQVEGQKARIAYSPENISDINIGGSFEIPLNEINLASYYASWEVPEGMAYISSKTGKYFYHILDPRALRIVPKNRVYFATEEEAWDFGYLAPK